MTGRVVLILVAMSGLLAYGCWSYQSAPSVTSQPTPEKAVRQYYEYIWKRSDRLEVVKTEELEPRVETFRAIIKDDDFRKLSDAALKSGKVIEGWPCKNLSYQTRYRLTLYDRDRCIAVFNSDLQWKINLENSCDYEFFIGKSNVFWTILSNANYRR